MAPKDKVAFSEVSTGVVSSLLQEVNMNANRTNMPIRVLKFFIIVFLVNMNG
jgi:hypothetical protein